ncbi:succinate dehydrogenase cytochrome b558 subunit [Oceanobacillus profundus]|uniref:Succinate dehydrogenase n=1 Tax=Oceanobacillus profundus TaxID=372463 RepID=A0A417YJ02_9BACI|nr:succinate dehydrogenase cytochrome b558 subunit [Oceanobacillus profundus]MBR3119273.1 succinate dehydrogenase cytochrome b558 subunit [Oceanobacillus sp.]PAE30908.1 succinate dehydrogenase [Paenibacillus sp. 7884-2]MCM3400254.1 succinate dehydrogenase cytochrome b558 subunit [Oceanobacillus profundus]MDO6448316.1 succinate dehydrogenase cytochrome b558 subunit [Oceanobacillus profundus]RHW32999.1 succinate dehydrogenase [Oceanobacillus profundus]
MAEHREFFYRRLHSLLGVVPIGLFMVQHLVINHFAVYGEESFNRAAGFMAGLPFVLLLEIFVIYLPILFHAILGVYIVFVARNNTRTYGFFRNWMFRLQRITGIVTLVFIAWHVWETRVQIGLGNVDLDYSLMEGILTNPFMFWFYVIGVVSAVFHFANGLWSFLVTWGITQSPKSQKIATYAVIVVFFAISYLGVRTLIQFAYGV